MERTPLLRHFSELSGSDDSDVYHLIAQIRTDLLNIIDQPLLEDQLRSAPVLHSIVKPLENAYVNTNPAIIYSLLVNRLHFIRIQRTSPSFHSINATRASLCEILAIRVLERIRNQNAVSPDETLLYLANVLVRCFSPFQGAPASVIPDEIASQVPLKGQTSAFEIAIVTQAKLFICSPAVQQVVGGIYTGRIIYAATSFFDILPDHYKRKQVTLYSPRGAPILDHYRLKVPRVRQALETSYFLVLFLSFFVVHHPRRFIRAYIPERLRLPPNAPLVSVEKWLIFYGMGLTLDKIASVLEHGWSVFTANMWNGLDIAFCACFSVYLFLLASGNGEAGHAILACGAVLLFPRLAFVMLSNNLLVLALRALMADFFFLIILAAWCFLGFLYALWILGAGKYSMYDISRWMIWIWFGLDATGLALAPKFHPFWGPVLLVAYTCFSTTLLLTVLVSILATRFSDIHRDAVEEYIFRQAVVIFEGIKSDAIFNYYPPINLLALVVLTPMRFVMTPRRFHSLNVLCTRVSSAPILILIALFERRLFTPNHPPSPPVAAHPELKTRGLRRFGARADVEALLDLFAENHDGAEPPILSPHLSCSLVIERESDVSEESDTIVRDMEWQKELKERLGNIEAALLDLSKYHQ